MGNSKIFHQGKALKEYTLLSAASVLAVIILDRILKTKLISNREFWILWIVMFIIMFFINGYLTWRPIVIYGSEFYLGIRLFTIPIEDFLFGFSLLTSNIIIWEYYTKRHDKEPLN